METRSNRILNMARKKWQNDENLEYLTWPSYETTSGLQQEYREYVVQNSFKILHYAVSTAFNSNGNEIDLNESVLSIQSVASTEFNNLENPNLFLKNDSDLSSTCNEETDTEYIPSTDQSTDTDKSLSVIGKVSPLKELFMQDYENMSIKNLNKPLSPTIDMVSEIEVRLLDGLDIKGSKKFSVMEEKNGCTSDDSAHELPTDVEPTKQMNIEMSTCKLRSGKRIRDKRHACYFCLCTYINLPRHYESVHENESAVAAILAMQKNSKERKREFLKLMRAGDFFHNCEVISCQKGELILARRPTKTGTRSLAYSDYGPCPDCLGFFIKKHMWYHMKYRCFEKNKYISSSERRQPVAESNAILNVILNPDFSSDFMMNIVGKLRDDDVSQICKEDKLILRFGSMQYEKYSMTQAELIRQGMRQLGRLVMEIHKQSIYKGKLSDYLVPDKFDLIVRSTKTLCASHSEVASRPEFKIPSLALKIGYSIRKCASIERGIHLRRGDLKKNNILVNFLALMDLEWSVKISSNALSTLHRRKFNSVQLLPITKDLIKLNSHLNSAIDKYVNNLKTECNYNMWSKLAIYVLARIIMFNKRRSGESAKMKLCDYSSRPIWSDASTDELKNSLTMFEKKLADKLVLVEIEGKRGRKVPVLLMPNIKSSIDLLISTRQSVGISSENPYVFARLNSDLSHLRGHDSLSKVCSEADLHSPHLITSTKLRKYIATASQIFDLSENESDWLAKHLGHDVRVHRDFYRLHEGAVELTKISRILLAVDQGKANTFSGKKLVDIELSDLPALEEGEENPATDEENGNSDKEDIPDVAKKSSKITGKTSNENKKPVMKGKNKVRSAKNPWTLEEKSVVLKYFHLTIKRNGVPGKEQCLECQIKFPILKERKWTDIKFCVKNHLSRINRKVKCSSIKIKD